MSAATAGRGTRIEERIAAHRDELTPQGRRAAATLLEHLDDLATYRATELAELAGVSKATMSRLFRRLGFADFDDVRDHLRSARADGAPRAAGDSDLAAHLLAESAALHRAVTQPAVAAAAGLLAAARRVVVVGGRNGYPVALHLRQQLAHVRDDVRLAPAPGQVLGEELVGLTAGDAIVVLGFRRRPAGFDRFLAEARDTGAGLVLVTDATGARYRAAATVWLECPVEGALAFDSYASAMSLVCVLAHAVLRHAGDAGGARVAAISESYRRLDEVER